MALVCPPLGGGVPPLPPPPPPPVSVSVGVIFPPADIRGIIDKTAAFVGKNGVEFEQRVLREQNNARFSFLQPGNPYRPYYEMKVRECQTGKVGTALPMVPQAIQDMQKKEAERAKKKEQLLMLTQHADTTAEIKQPEADKFCITHPPIAPVDLDIIKVTAQFVARNGQKFLVGLTQRERNNPQFQFLQPSHFLFKYFTILTDMYTLTLLPEKSHLEKLHVDALISNSKEILSRCQMRYLWNCKVETEKKEKEKKAEDERLQMQNIDWHDFEIVETIKFTSEDEDCDLPEPIDFSGERPKGPPAPLDTRPASGGSTVIDKNRLIRDEIEMEIEDGVEVAAATTDNLSENLVRVLSDINTTGDDNMVGPSIQLPVGEVNQLVPQLPPPAPPPVSYAPEADKIVIVRDYVRQPKRQRVSGAVSGRMLRCPITGSLLAAEDMSKHLRILLLDPKWKEQKDKLVERARKETAFAPEFDVEDNLAQFVARRPDLFGSVEDEIQEHTTESAEM